MIPPFNDSGFLPAGVHPATLAEIAERFGKSSELRRVQMDSVRWMIDLALKAGARRIVLNGSFVTDIMEPNDVDCVLLFAAGQRRDWPAMKQLRNGLPFLEISLVDQSGFDDLVNFFFATDRLGSEQRNDRGDSMRLLSDVELANTRRKLDELEALYAAREGETGGDEELRDMTMQSLMRLINQLKEEITRSEAHLVAR